MNFRKYRVRGRISFLEDVNTIFPKFLVLSEEPFLDRVIESVEELAGIGDTERIFEPIEVGLGVKSEVMYVKSKNRTYLFSYKIEDDIRWGSNVVNFAGNVNFNGDVSEG